MKEPRIFFHTNLDEPKRFVEALNDNYNDAGPWMGPVPHTGERIMFRFQKWNKDIGGSEEASFELEVVGVSWRDRGTLAWVELYMPSSYSSMNISEWIHWFRKHVEGKDY